MSENLGTPGTPCDGPTVIVVIATRISSRSQTQLSLARQVELGKQVVADMWKCPVEVRVLSINSAGKRLDRPKFAEMPTLASGRVDLLVFEDPGRLAR